MKTVSLFKRNAYSQSKLLKIDKQITLSYIFSTQIQGKDALPAF